MSAHNTFTALFAACLNEVSFNPQWPNGTGYLDAVCEEKHLVVSGQVAKTIDPYGRKVLIAGTKQGPVAIFERYPADLNPFCGVLVANFPFEIDSDKSGFPHGPISENNINRIFTIDKGVVRNQLDEHIKLRSAKLVERQKQMTV